MWPFLIQTIVSCLTGKLVIERHSPQPAQHPIPPNIGKGNYEPQTTNDKPTPLNFIPNCQLYYPPSPAY